MLVPIGWFYLSRHDWLEAAAQATFLIGVVWLLLFGAALCVGGVVMDFRDWRARRVVHEFEPTRTTGDRPY